MGIPDHRRAQAPEDAGLGCAFPQHARDEVQHTGGCPLYYDILDTMR